MAEGVQGRQVEEGGGRRLFVLASELEAGLEAAAERREKKRRLLLSAGVLLPGEGWGEAVAIAMTAGVDVPPGNYGDGPVGPGGACDGTPGQPCPT